MKKERVSNNVVRRMPRYLRKLDELSEKGIARVSSFELGQQMGLTPSQIRQDFSCFGEFGQQGYGYNVTVLRQQVAAILGTDKGYHAIMVGVGRIGLALLDNFNFGEWGVSIDCAFDKNPSKVGETVNGIQIMDSDNLCDYLKTHSVDMVILAVSRVAALPVADMLIANGVKAIWNLTNVELVGPDSPIIVENLHFSDSLLALSYYIGHEAEKKAALEAEKNDLT